MLQVERDQPQGYDSDVAIRPSEGFQAEEVVLVMLCIPENVAQIMMWGFTWDHSAGECFHPAVDCSIMPPQTVSDKSKVQVTIEEAQGAQS